MNTNTNTSAFPWTVDDGESVIGNKGMTLRDYFAAKAMQGLIAHEERAKQLSGANLGDFDERVAFAAFRYADKMMKARGK
jgi:hypothetical protein